MLFNAFLIRDIFLLTRQRVDASMIASGYLAGYLDHQCANNCIRGDSCGASMTDQGGGQGWVPSVYIADDNQNSNPSASSATTMRKAHPSKISPLPTFLGLLPVGINPLIGDPGMLRLAG